MFLCKWNYIFLIFDVWIPSREQTKVTCLSTSHFYTQKNIWLAPHSYWSSKKWKWTKSEAKNAPLLLLHAFVSYVYLAAFNFYFQSFVIFTSYLRIFHTFSNFLEQTPTKTMLSLRFGAVVLKNWQLSTNKKNKIQFGDKFSNFIIKIRHSCCNNCK